MNGLLTAPIGIEIYGGRHKCKKQYFLLTAPIGIEIF